PPMYDLKNLRIAVIGLGYVGLPLALEFAKKRKVIGFDINNIRIEELSVGKDKNREFTKKNIQESNLLNFTNNQDKLEMANCFIVTVPTPVDTLNKPNLDALISASEIVSKKLKKLVYALYTIYPRFFFLSLCFYV
ncbi:MAG: Vi polysaccharide biosynthesis UDP-N-acetylglucosamine C-6 dehydrogenase TviB, partial [Planktomarina sp.]|nr:Vi polysaccharide biosynthesis UDP-N-acetylglucosamine C-6 dehydrogenase TviB [Planktomarina sp.]